MRAIDQRRSGSGGASPSRWRRTAAGIALAVGALTAVGGAAGCGGSESAAPPGSPPAPAVSVTRPAVRQVTDWDVYSGRLAPVESVDVRARVSGYLETAPFDEGAIVHQGDVLFTIDARPYQAELERAQAEVASAEAQQRLAASELDRISSLRQSGAVSETEFFNARRTLESAQASVAAAQAAVELARLNVEWCRVRAPITGRVGRKLITPGNFVTGPGGQQPPLLTSITSQDPIYCYIEVDERSLRRYQQATRNGERPSIRAAGPPAQLALTDETEFRHRGFIDFVDNRVDPATGTITMRGVFANPTGELLPGFFARLRVPGRGPYEAVLVPEEAVGANLSQQYVLVVGPDNVVRSQPVRTGGVFGGLRAVEGLAPDARVVVTGLVQAQAGVKVRPQEVPIETLAAGASPRLSDEAAEAGARLGPSATGGVSGGGGAGQ